MLSNQFIKDVYNQELSPVIKEARALSDKLRMHVDGINYQDELSRINSYENEDQALARKKHAISNQFITEELLRPTDNAFAAKGGSKYYKFKTSEEENTKKLVEKLMAIKKGQSLSEYIENEWFHKFIIDPNGLIFLEVITPEKTIEDQEPEPYLEPTYKSIHSIRAYQQCGQRVEWVIFEPHKVIFKESESNKPEIDYKIFWVVDGDNYAEYKLKDGVISRVKLISNSFGYVPAVLCSNITDQTTGLKASPIQKQVELLDRYLVSNSVLTIAEFFHNYPREWTYVDYCIQCQGTGKIMNQTGSANQFDECSTCSGTGKSDRKDVTDILKLRVPDKDGVKIDPPSGYTYVPVDAWLQMEKSVDRTWNLIYYSQWGTTTERKDNETATGRFIDVQPVNNRLNKYSRSIELTHAALAQMIGEYYYPETFDKAYIQYGRRYMVETSDQIWEKYLKAKKEKAPITILDILLDQYLESEYRENERLYIIETKKAKIEPFVHWDIETVRNSTVIRNEDKAKKEYFNEWWEQVGETNALNLPIEKLKEMLKIYIDNLKIEYTLNVNANE